MQAKPFHNIPTKFPSPIKLPPLHRISSPARVRTPRVISISAPDSHNTHVSTLENIDDSVAAFWDYQFLFVSQRSETVKPVNLRVIDGAVPPDFPSGTYYLTGPGLFTDDHGSTVHPLDGHGYLRAFSIDGANGEVKFMARYVKTEAQVEEHDPETGTWRFTHRGPFSVLKGGGNPYEIESGTLDTIGRFDLVDGCDSLMDDANNTADVWDIAAGLLKPILYGVFKMSPKRFLSHYKLDAKRSRLLTMSCNAEDMLLPRKFDQDFNLLQRREFSIPDHLMIHDWAFTDSYYILFANRIKLDVIGSMTAVCGLSPMLSALSVNPSKSTSPIYLLPRFPDHKGHRDWKVPVEATSQMWLLHVGNAFEAVDENGNLEVQVHACTCSYQWFNFQRMFGYNWQSDRLDPSVMNVNERENELLPHLVKVSIDLNSNGSCQRSTSSGSRRALPHFPFDTVVKLNALDKSTNTWSVGARRFIGEPVFVPKKGEEDDGYLLIVELRYKGAILSF
uniref:CCD7 n=1 Tax=Jatropha curcas TaxID=180498 RepID=A0A0H3WJB9_JATCU|nr:CCD7 [Jatropha curcas]